ncbi:MAG: EcsC family protein [Tangfeifania sp.]
MDDYQNQILPELSAWQKQMLRRPTVINRLSKSVQVKMNSWIPEKIHRAITVTIKQMIRGVLFGANYTTAKPLSGVSLQEREAAVRQRIKIYKNTAAAEGGVTGAGGILLGFADFPVLIGLKLKLLFDISSMYGFNVKDYRERVYILHIFELAFSGHEHRRKIYLKMVDWEKKSSELPEDIYQFDWRNFQQEYRDYLDIAKMAQLIPFIGAPVGFVVNSRLINKLGKTAMNAYRMRLFSDQ